MKIPCGAAVQNALPGGQLDAVCKMVSQVDLPVRGRARCPISWMRGLEVVSAMLTELTVIPVRGNPDSSGVLADMLREITAAGLPYQLTPSSICLDGPWDAVMSVAKACHAIARRDSSRVVTLLKIEDDENAKDKLRQASAREDVPQSILPTTDAMVTETVAPDPLLKTDPLLDRR
jgi:uncharacterized protein YqgV (UPF0045/DUF77 family)